jgi:hypothetical protein
LKRFIGGFLEINDDLFDNLLEPDRILAGLVTGGSRCRESPVRPFGRIGVGDGRDVCGDLRGLSVDWRRTEHKHQPTIEAVIHPIVQREACNHSCRHRESRTASQAGG